jgi:phosphoglycolate phosphatase
MEVTGPLPQIMKNYSAVVWDWNGTLLDDVEVAVSTIQEILVEHELPQLSVQDYRKIFGFPVYNYYEKLGFDFTRTPFKDVADRFIEVYGKNVDKAQLFPDVVEALRFNHVAGRPQFILSAGHQKHLDEVVKKFGVEHFFTEIYGIGDHYAGSKLDRGRDLLREHPLEPQKTVLIGDTDHDLEVGRELGLDVYLLADGHQCHTRLESVWHQVLRTRFVT